MKICLFGDSITRGVIYDENKGKYAFLKESFVNLLSSRQKVEIKNYSAFGCTLTKGEELVNSHLGELKDYDYIALEFGGNDCNMDWAAVAQNPGIAHNPATPLNEFDSSYIRVIEKIKAAGGTPVLLTLPPLNASRFFNWVSKDLAKEKILEFLGDVEFISLWQESYNNLIYKIAEKTDTPVINIRGAFDSEKKLSALMCVDGMHPNAAGHNAMLKKLGELEELIRRNKKMLV